jgi:hypothetical protein
MSIGPGGAWKANSASLQFAFLPAGEIAMAKLIALYHHPRDEA